MSHGTLCTNGSGSEITCKNIPMVTELFVKIINNHSEILHCVSLMTGCGLLMGHDQCSYLIAYLPESNHISIVAHGHQALKLNELRTDDTNKKIDAWIDIYFLTYFHCKLY
jgi:hypothetical protein